MTFSIRRFCREVMFKSSDSRPYNSCRLKHTWEKCIAKTFVIIGEVFPENFRIFGPLVKIRQTRAESSKTLMPRQNAWFSANLGIFWNSHKTFLEENQKFLQYICSIYFLKNRNYDLFISTILARGYVQIIRFKASLLLQIKTHIREMYSKNIRNNWGSILLKFQDIRTIGQILANSSRIEQNPCAHAKCLIFGKSRNLLKLSQNLLGRKSKVFAIHLFYVFLKE